MVSSDILNTKLVGFENHSGRTHINGYRPLGKVLYGNGNNGLDRTEGLIYRNTVCTYMHGCCLAKNPELTKFLILKAIKKKYQADIELHFDETLFLESKNDAMMKIH